MKRFLYIVLIAMLGSMYAAAQATDGLWLTSRQRMLGTQSSVSSPGALPGTAAPVSVAPSSVSVAVHTPAMMASGSRYSSEVTAVGAKNVSSVIRPRREGENPFGGETIGDTPNPNEPGTPLGDIPFLLMALLAVIYAFAARTKCLKSDKRQ
ncbi:MAG: hypothetical protein IJ776_11285 [Paludibacteraceae bacterium]|nr:hypothetical protein [Paludibacteraceae bacterium]